MQVTGPRVRRLLLLSGRRTAGREQDRRSVQLRLPGLHRAQGRWLKARAAAASACAPAAER